MREGAADGAISKSHAGKCRCVHVTTACTDRINEAGEVTLFPSYKENLNDKQQLTKATTTSRSKPARYSCSLNTYREGLINTLEVGSWYTPPFDERISSKLLMSGKGKNGSKKNDKMDEGRGLQRLNRALHLWPQIYLYRMAERIKSLLFVYRWGSHRRRN